MDTKRKNIIKLVTYLAFFILVGFSLGVAASEFTMVEAINTPTLGIAVGTEADVQTHPFWLLVSVLIGYILMTQRKGI